MVSEYYKTLGPRPLGPKLYAPYGEDTLYAKGFDCALCIKIRKLLYGSFITSGGWCDPRRGYLEPEDEFLKRILDGFLKWPEDHK